MNESSQLPLPLLPSILSASVRWRAFLLHGFTSRRERLSNTYNKEEMKKPEGKGTDTVL